MGDLVKIKPYLTELKIIEQTQGYVMHGMRSSDGSCAGFGEAYFSTVNNGMIKGWKLHRKMTLNLIVPHGEIRFVVHGASADSLGGEVLPVLDVVLGSKNYSRLTVPPGFWVAFQGASAVSNILLNIANIEHDQAEAINRSTDFFNVQGFNLDE
jgi:dTDP-4-dehydrorhamnose 3,5-epimerase